MEALIESKEFKLIIKYLPNVELYQDEKGDIVNMSPVEVIDGPDGEFGIPGNIAQLCGFADRELINLGFDKHGKCYLNKIRSD